MRRLTTIAVYLAFSMAWSPVMAQGAADGDEPKSPVVKGAKGAKGSDDEPAPAKKKKGEQESPPAKTKAAAPSEEPAPPAKTAADSDEPAPPAKGGSEEPQAPGAASGHEPGQSIDGEPKDPNEPTAPAKPVATKKRTRKTPLQIGVGVHSRAMFLPSWLLGVGFDENTQMTSAAIGAEVVFRRGTFDIIGSIDLMFHGVDDGNFLGKGKNAATETDYLHFDNFNFLGFAVHFIKHHPVLPWMSIVWGGGVGLGITLGSIYRVSAGRGCNGETAGSEGLCIPDSASWDPRNPSDWMDDPINHGVDGDSCPADQKGQGLCDDYNNPKRFRDEDMWPVVPTIHLLAGVDFKISDHFSVRVDGGFRHLSFYMGATGHYFF